MTGSRMEGSSGMSGGEEEEEEEEKRGGGGDEQLRPTLPSFFSIIAVRHQTHARQSR